MSYHSKREARRTTEYDEDEDDLYGSSNRKSPHHETAEDTLSQPGSSPKDKPPMEQDKRLRREIANSNERRRMQSINSGFESLKTLIPHTDGEKLSKAAILHHTSDYITALESEKTRLLTQNEKLKRELLELGHAASRDTESDLSSGQGSPPPKRKKRDTESSDEGIGMSSGDFDEPTFEELKREMIFLRSQLDRERRLRIMLEEQTRTLESQLYPERLRQIASQVQAQMRYQEEKQKYLEAQRRIQEEQEEALAVRNAPIITPTNPSSSPNPHIPSTQTPPIPIPIPAAVPAPSSPPLTIVSTPAAVSKRQPLPPAAPISTNSMSRRNLETIVEAIRHLEGDNILFDGVSQETATHIESNSPATSRVSRENNRAYSVSPSFSSSSDDEDDDFLECSKSTCSTPSSKSKMADATSLLALQSSDTTLVASVLRHEEVPRHNTTSQHKDGGSASTVSMLNSSDRLSIPSQLKHLEQQHGRIGFVPQRPAIIVQHLS